MILQATSIEEIKNALDTYNPRWIQLLSADRTQIIGFNANMRDLPEHTAQILATLQDKRLPPGTYIVELRSAKMKKGTEIHYSNTVVQLSDEPTSYRAEITQTKVKTDIISDQDLLEIRVENERLKIENQMLREENDQLIEEIETLQSRELSDPGTPTQTTIEKVMEIGAPILDNLFQMWNKTLETKQAELALKYTQNQQQQQPARSQIIQPNELSFEQIEQVRTTAPYEFYNWISNPDNKRHYDNLKSQQNEL
jgi:hypothetical protein